MGRDLAWVVGRGLIVWVPAAAFIAYASDAGMFSTRLAVVLLVIGLLAAVVVQVVAEQLYRSAARDAMTGLGPEGASSDRRHRLNPMARAIRLEALRLDRAWRRHSGAAESRAAAAETVIAAVPEPLILIDRQRRIVRSNAAAAEFVEPEAGPRDLAAALRNPMLLAAADAVLRGEAAKGVEFTLSGPIERVLRAELARIGEPALDGAAAILSLHDVTALKRSEQMRADFIANAGHELKTPLATLVGFIATLLGPAKNDAAARERFLGIMQEQAQRMSRLVDDLLSLSKIELNEHIAPTDRVALAPVVEEVARGLELRAAEREIRIVRALPSDLPAVQGDRDELAQIFQNLLDNAVKYGRRKSQVTVTGGSDGAAPELVRVDVIDQGDGIPREQLPRLTERFYRVDTARSRELGGTGLGLAIVKHIVSRHRGRLEIVSEVGHGSTFTVWLRAAGAL